MFEEVELIWNQILSEVQILCEREILLLGFYHSYILNHKNFGTALSYMLSNKLGNKVISAIFLRDIIQRIYDANFDIIFSAIKDIQAIHETDLSDTCYAISFLYSKEFHALQAYRISNFFWNSGRKELAIYFQNCISFVFSIDIHPKSLIENGIVLSHTSGIVIGRKAEMENRFSNPKLTNFKRTKIIKDILCPKIYSGVTIGSGVIILGNVEIGPNVSISPGTVVLTSIYV
ncbi:MAG: serine O-acetyltransferase [Buchnera aphidicola (Nurudea shiraii)]